MFVYRNYLSIAFSAYGVCSKDGSEAGKRKKIQYLIILSAHFYVCTYQEASRIGVGWVNLLVFNEKTDANSACTCFAMITLTLTK